MTRLLDVVVVLTDHTQDATGRVLDRVSVLLEDAADWCRFLAALTRACP